jgi:hypothetical protein
LVGGGLEHGSLIPADWRLKPGVFNITDVLDGADPSDEDIQRAYGYYLTHQSAALDWEIIVRTLTAR